MKIFKSGLGYKQLNFGCNAKMEGYANLSSHIPKLGENLGNVDKMVQIESFMLLTKEVIKYE